MINWCKYHDFFGDCFRAVGWCGRIVSQNNKGCEGNLRKFSETLFIYYNNTAPIKLNKRHNANRKY